MIGRGGGSQLAGIRDGHFMLHLQVLHLLLLGGSLQMRVQHRHAGIEIKTSNTWRATLRAPSISACVLTC